MKLTVTYDQNCADDRRAAFELADEITGKVGRRPAVVADQTATPCTCMNQ